MPHTRPHRRLLIVIVVAIVGAVIACQQGPISQKPASDYIDFLERQSMLFQAQQQADRISGAGVQWREDYGAPESGKLVRLASVWLLYYPGSVVPKPGQSVIGTLAEPKFWDAVRDIGIEALHINPTQRAGGIRQREFTPTIDGWFDRIGLDTAPELGTEEEFRRMVDAATARGAIVAGDLVPLHSGMGPDFRLAERAYKDYPGLYTMVEIKKEDWGLLPQVSDPWLTALVSKETAVQLRRKGYIPGLINSADASAEARDWSGWSATAEVVGVDGKARRWVYLHVFKPGQPAFNWLDPSYAAQRVQYGDAARNILGRGVKVLRLDADTFLGLEPRSDDTAAAYYLTPLANLSTTDIAFAVRKIGGFTFQEFAAPLAQLKTFAPRGPDLSYDFFTRAEVLYPVINGDVLPLRLAHQFLLDSGVPAGTLVHSLQNHDEITFQLFELGSHDDFRFEGRTHNGKQIKDRILNTLRSTVGAVPYNKLYRPQQDGIATTFAGFLAPALGIHDPYHATPDQVALIRRAHLLAAHANAMIPGVFALAAWDFVGALPVAVKDIPGNLTAGDDWRWINRGGVDLLGENPGEDKSAFGLPKAKTLYGPVPEQLRDPESFASQIKRMLAARKRYRIHEGAIISVPNSGKPGVVLLVMTLPDNGGLAITALNYGRTATSVKVDLTQFSASIPAASVAGQTARDIVREHDAGVVTGSGRLNIDIGDLSGRTLVIRRRT